MLKQIPIKVKLRRTAYLGGFLLGAMMAIADPIFAQEEMPMPQPSPATEESLSGLNEPFFADVMVEGRPIFQVGSVGNMTARERVQIINRRISSLRGQSETLDSITVQYKQAENYATLQVNNRVIMTVIQQDAEDFGVDNAQVLASQWAEELNQALDRPPLAIDVAQRLNATVRNLIQDAISNLPSLVGALIVILLTWGVAITVRQIAYSWAQKTEGDRSTELLISRLGYGAIWVIGWVIALGVLGLDFAALLGALGLTSVAIGFSLKDVLSNYIAGVILLAVRPFRIGDQIAIDEYEGTVTEVQLRTTTIKTYDGRLIYIPNQEVFSSSITNNTASPRRRTSVMVGVDYEADINQAKAAILKALSELDLVESSPAPEVLVRELAASTINLEIRFWVDSRRAEFLEMTSQGAQRIKEALDSANIEMPTEIYTLNFRNLPPSISASVNSSPPSG
ncbi:mechanosensitive ion channel family protein [Phormidium pseudopriestleyi FRX01]|uniref:Mechanosensitive ion channel family protein n=1 Tax=Phormidium pseudopriestleyi FRX01 TaxID=1759528 RepID=A0ABS3FLI0_9CYAN|nr:mechanosensitive ion channel family protein [Phormidium pseudopriestleyi]MBO0347965.1 mechanosensitive ion channel family protein [Phormidium pseudopriestleyi FRX01]